MSLSHYDAPSGSYTSRIPPGTAALRDFIKAKFGISRAEIVRDPGRCRSQRSEHCECGAVDFFPPGQSYAIGRAIFDWCVNHAEAAGIQSVIFARRVAGFGDPDERHYSGPAGHFDHDHVGLNRWARQNLTIELLRRIDGSEEDDLTDDERKMLKDTYNAVFTWDGDRRYEHLNIIQKMLKGIAENLGIEFNYDGSVKTDG